MAKVYINSREKYIKTRTHETPLIASSPDPKTEIIVVIPCYKEEFNECQITFDSLLKAYENCSVISEIILVLNGLSEELESESNSMKNFIQGFNSWYSKGIKKLRFHLIVKEFPTRKEGGVGRARKIGMDEALIRLESIQSKDGVIVCLDADTRVNASYFQIIYKSFSETSFNAFSLGFAHDLNENAIIKYELHLRYFINIQRYYLLPFAFQTVGSAMAVRSRSYADLGGMNSRLAGEDFYFLHKYISRNQLADITEIIVCPSGRISDRVPFGTGKAVAQIQEDKGAYLSYDPHSFEVFALLPKMVLNYWASEQLEISDPILFAFFESHNAEDTIQKMKIQSKSYNQFQDKFFSWFNAFRLFKYLHFAREKGNPDLPVLQCVNGLFNKLGIQEASNELDALTTLRNLDANTKYKVQYFNAMQAE